MERRAKILLIDDDPDFVEGSRKPVRKSLT